jgi:hypothetical protein
MIPRANRKPSPLSAAGPAGDTYTWMLLLAERLARRDRLQEMSAPQTILDAELELVERAKAALTAGQVLFVLHRRDDLISYFDAPDPLEAEATDPS